MHSDAVLDQCGKCFWRILIDFVSGAGDDMQMGLRQECVQLFCGFEICTILFSTDDGHRTVYFGKLRAEIKHAHGMGQFERVMFGKSHVGKCVLWHTAEDQILKIDQSGWYLVLRAN